MQTPAPVDYARATSIDHALQLMAERGPEARLIAGGHSLIPMMRLRIARPECVIDINDLAELDYIRVEEGELGIGAMTRHAALLASPVVGEHYAIFHDAERRIADPPVRNRGTIGGSLCQGDPAEDLAAVASALRADLVLRSSQRTRTVPAREFHLGPYETAIDDAEMLTEVRVPIRPGVSSAYEKVKRRGRRLGGRERRRVPRPAGRRRRRRGHRPHRGGRPALLRRVGRGLPPSGRPPRRNTSEPRPSWRPTPARRARTSGARWSTSATSPASSPSAFCAGRSNEPRGA